MAILSYLDCFAYLNKPKRWKIMQKVMRIYGHKKKQGLTHAYSLLFEKQNNAYLNKQKSYTSPKSNQKPITEK